MASDSLIALLEKTDLFRGLPDEDLRACAAHFREQRFPKGEMLFARGDAGARLYLVREGRVRLAVISDDGRELSFRHAAEGELFGEIAALDGGARTADATALTNVATYTLERETLRQLRAERPAIGDHAVAFLCRRLRETSAQLEAIALYPLEVRLARFLLFALHGRQPEPGKRVPLDLGFSQSELAQLLGATRPKVNGALGVLEEAGAIGRTIDRMFCDPVKLAAFARQHDA
jgi:CRP/FNR family transcriptional regulator, cyclic AMP receptor protein